MYDTDEMAKRIKLRLKQRKGTVKEMLHSCELAINTVSKLSAGAVMSSINLAKIADYLECSVDYLMGRTDNPEVNRWGRDRNINP